MLSRRVNIVFVCLALFATQVFADNVIRVGSYLNERSTGISQVIKPWLEAMRHDIGNEVRFEEYWGGTLGKSPQKQYELVRSGVLDVAWILPGYTPGQFPELGLFELPYLFESSTEASTVGWALHEQGLISGLDGIRIIGIFTTEPNGLFMRRRLDEVVDMSGYKIRSIGAIHSDWLESMGASAQTMSAVDMNQALDRDIIDGVIQGWSGMRTFDSFPLVKEAWLLPLGTTPFLVLINEDTWQRQPRNVQQAIMKHGGLSIARAGGRAYADIGHQIRQNLRRDEHIPVLVPGEKETRSLRQVSLREHEQWAEKVPGGQKIYEVAQALLSEYRQLECDQ